MCGCKETRESSEPFVHAKSPIEEGVLSEQTVQAVLRSWSIQDAVADIPVLLLPEPIVYLIQHRKWKRLLIMVRWQTTHVEIQRTDADDGKLGLRSNLLCGLQRD